MSSPRPSNDRIPQDMSFELSDIRRLRSLESTGLLQPEQATQAENVWQQILGPAEREGGIRSLQAAQLPRGNSDTK
jgi:hypothetical protein